MSEEPSGPPPLDDAPARARSGATPSPWERLAIALALFALLAPCAVALFESATHPVIDATPVHDESSFEARVLTLFEPPVLVGPYSRHHWNHPGPLAFWLFGLPYWLFGRAPLALHVVAALVSCASLLAIARSALGLTREPATHAVVLAFLTVLVAQLSSSYAPSGFTAVWNPVFTLLPYAALLLHCVELAEGRSRALVPAALLHAFVTQSHVAFVLPATLAVTMALGLAARRRLLTGAERGHWLTAIALAVLLWAPVAFDAFFGSGNLQSVVRFFLSSTVEFPTGPARALPMLAWRATAPFRALADSAADRPMPDAVDADWPSLLFACALGALLAAGLISGYLRHRRGPRRDLATLCLLLGGQLLVGAVALLRIDQPQFAYHTWWLGVLGVLAALAGTLAHLPPLRGPASDLLVAASAVVALALTTRTSVAVVTATEPLVEDAESARSAIQPLLPALERAYACHPGAALRIADHDLWGVLGAVLVNLEREDLSPGLDPEWAFMFGPGYPTTAETQTFLLGADGAHECRLLARSAWLRASVCGLPPGVLATPSSAVRVRIVASEGLDPSADLARLTDGVRPPDGTVWNDAAALVLAPGRQSLTAVLPSSGVDGLVLTADHNESWRVEASMDGIAYAELGALEPAPGPGLRARTFFFDDDALWTHVRLTVTDGDGATSVAELEAVPRAAFVVDLGTPAARAHLREGWSGDEGGPDTHWVWATGHVSVIAVPAPRTESTLLVSLDPYAALPRTQSVTVRLGDQAEEHALAPGLQTLRVPVRAHAGPDETLEVRLVFSEAVSPRELGLSEDPRPLAAAVHRLELRPALELCAEGD